jgi:Glycosyltransferase family 25 (LPS biosynthesis protein)
MNKNKVLNVPFLRQNIIFSILQKYKVNTTKIINDSLNEKIINQHVCDIYVINLEDNLYRKKYIELLFKKYGINYTLVSVKRPDSNMLRHFSKSMKYSKFRDSEFGCLLSHLWCLHDAFTKQHKNIIIFEDDIILHKNFHELFEKYMTNGVQYDFLMLGASDFDFKYKNSITLDSNKGLYQILPNSANSYGAHALYYSQQAIKFVLEERLKEPVFYDKGFSGIFQKFSDTAFVCYPNLVLTEFSTTNLYHDYTLTEKEDLYYNNCFIDLCFNNYNFIYLGLFIKNKEFIQSNSGKLYKEILEKLLEKYKNINHQDYSSRFVLDFFTLDDILYIIC